MRGNLWQPTNVNEIREELQRTRNTIVLRGAGNSSVNAPLNAEGITIDLSHMQNLKWDLEKNVVHVEPGVTVHELCRQALIQGLWPPVVPVTAQATLGGSLSVNAYGANPYIQGPIGEHIVSFELLLATGNLLEVSHLQGELFKSVIGGLGLLGVITNIAIQLQPINSDELLIRHFVAPSFSDMISIFDEQAISADYLVGWVDSHARGNQSGRGVVISGKYADVHELQHAAISSRANDVSATMPSMQRLLRILMNSGGARVANSLYYNLSKSSREEPYQRMPIVEFHSRFYPWYHPLHATRHMKGYFFQPFVPAAKAQEILPQLLEYSHQAGFIPFRCILRRHNTDSYQLSYQIDGFSLELVYAVSPEKRDRLMRLLEELHEQVINEGGRFYPARDVALSRSTYENSMGKKEIQRFKELKQMYDPDDRFQSTLYHRLFLKM